MPFALEIEKQDAPAEVAPQRLRIKLERKFIPRKTPLGEIQQDTHRFRVFASIDDGQHVLVASVCDHPGAPINFLRHDVLDEIRDAVRTAVAQELGGGERKESAPPPIVEEVDESDGDDDEEAEDGDDDGV